MRMIKRFTPKDIERINAAAETAARGLIQANESFMRVHRTKCSVKVNTAKNIYEKRTVEIDLTKIKGKTVYLIARNPNPMAGVDDLLISKIIIGDVIDDKLTFAYAKSGTPGSKRIDFIYGVVFADE